MCLSHRINANAASSTNKASTISDKAKTKHRGAKAIGQSNSQPSLGLPIEAFLDEQKSRLLIDVRSPAEFAQGHIPGAWNLPLFSDAERAQIGTLYKQKGRQTAILQGLKFTGKKLDYFYESVLERAQGRGLAVHCWRGGMRSASMAHFFLGLGFSVVTLEGGYKAFRRHVLNQLEHLESAQLGLLVLGGYTGSGKTEILQELKRRGEAVIDLEGLARHKGSAFGGDPKRPQPSQEHFENLLYMKLCHIDKRKEVWVEDESAHIGRIQVPKTFFGKIRNAPLISIELPAEVRAARLAKEYADLPKDYLLSSVERIRKRLGGQRAKASSKAIQEGDYTKAAREILSYYDKTYAYGQSKRRSGSIYKLSFPAFDLQKMADAILDLYRNVIRPDLLRESKGKRGPL